VWPPMPFRNATIKESRTRQYLQHTRAVALRIELTDALSCFDSKVARLEWLSASASKGSQLH